MPALRSESDKAQFEAGVVSILRCALAKRHPLVVVRSCFWADAAKDYSAPSVVRGGTGILLAAASVPPLETAEGTAGTAGRPMGETPMPRRKAHPAL